MDPVDEFLTLRKSLGGGLAETIREACRTYVLSRQQADGGFAGPGGSSDIYYTFFALADLCLLGESFNSELTETYLSTFGDGESLDVVHHCCLMRCHNLIAMNKAFTAVGAKGIGRLIQRRRYQMPLHSA